MKFFYDMSTRAKLLSSFGLILLFCGAIVVNSIFSALNVANSAKNIDVILKDSHAQIVNLQKGILNLHDQVSDFVNPNNTRITSIEQFIQIARPDANALEAAIKAIDPKTIAGHIPAPPEFSEKLHAILKDTQDYLSFVRGPIYDLYRKNQKQETLILFNEQGTNHLHKILDAISDAGELQNQIAREYATGAASVTTIMINGMLGLIVLVFGVVLAFIISNYINFELQYTINLIKRIGQGDLSYNYTSKRKDEFGLCINTLNDARGKLQTALAKVREESSYIQQTIQNITNDSHVIEQNVSHAESLCVSVASAATEMVSTTQEIARNCEGAANLSSTSKDITNDAVTRIRNSVIKVKEQNEHARNNAEQIEGLAEKTRDISSIVNTIEDIASQTNLLALNAAIEAARAGEAGRGFAVVADEVRALASRTASSTQEIVKKVQAIQNETSQSSESIKVTVENMDLVAEEVTSIESIMQEITEHVNEVNTQITQIATAAEEQTTATSEISNSMTTVTHATKDISGSIQGDVHKLSSISNNLLALDKELSFFTLKA